MQKKVLVSGIQSSGKLHIGNYFGAIKQNIELGNSGDYDSYIFIADYHSMTSLTNAQERREHTFDAVCTYLACGLDPNKVTLFKQSDVLSHTELAWILNTITPLPMLMLAHSFKDKIFKSLEEKIGQENNDKPAYKQFIIDHKNHYIHQLHALLIQSDSGDHIVSDIAKSYDIKVSEVRFLAQAMISVFDLTSNQINAGLFTYPALMAADILMYNANIVPVGKDQEQHIEIAREIAGKFNRAYEEVFTMPQAYIVEDVATVPGVDGTKMSKSKKNYIPLFGTDTEIRKQVMSIVTDSARPEDKKNPDENNIYAIHKLFLNKVQEEELRRKFEDGGYGYKDAKDACAQAVIDFIAPLRERYNYFHTHPEEVYSILEEGKKKAELKARQMMTRVRMATGLSS